MCPPLAAHWYTVLAADPKHAVCAFLLLPCRRCLCEWLQTDAISRGLAAAATAGARAAVQAAVAAERHEVRIGTPSEPYALWRDIPCIICQVLLSAPAKHPDTQLPSMFMFDSAMCPPPRLVCGLQEQTSAGPLKCKWCHPHYWPLFAVDPQNVYNHTDHVTDCGEQCLLDLLSPGPGGCIARDCGRPDGPHHEAHSSRANSTLCGSSAADNRGKMHGELPYGMASLFFGVERGCSQLAALASKALEV